MKVLITYNSIHHGNTEKVAIAMASAIDADLLKYDEVDGYNILDYDIVGFGSGIYYGKPNKELMEFIEKLPTVKNRKAFVFITSGKENAKYGVELEKKISKEGFEVVGKYSCKAFDTWGPLKLIGGINKGKPDEKDLEEAEIFIKDLIENV